MHHPVMSGLLIWAAVALAVLCSLGVAIMRDPFQRLHYSAAVVIWSVPMVVVAIWIENPDWQARLKSLLVFMVLFWMNSIITHATARAIRIRRELHLEPTPGEHIEAPRRD